MEHSKYWFVSIVTEDGEHGSRNKKTESLGAYFSFPDAIYASRSIIMSNFSGDARANSDLWYVLGWLDGLIDGLGGLDAPSSKYVTPKFPRWSASNKMFEDHYIEIEERSANFES